MVAYEAKTHFERTEGWNLAVTWDDDVAAASRTSGKFFEDNRRLIQGVAGHFEDLIESNHGTFFPRDRRAPWLDLLRDDLAVATQGRVPLLTNIGGHYLMGMTADHVASWESAGEQAFLLARGIGNMASRFVGAEEIHQHSNILNGPEISWWDGKSKKCFPNILAGEFDPAMSAALITIQGTCVITEQYARTRCCTDCESAALKHRFVLLYQILKSLDSLNASTVALGPIARQYLTTALEAPFAAEMLAERRYRQLRNGLVHLGFADLKDRVEGDWTFDSMIRAYSGRDRDVLEGLVDVTLRDLAETLTAWVLAPATRGGLFRVLRKKS
ncbi:hypothetical protein LN996_02420 [Arthrobacter sp. AK01]|uniref:hypothetical protein n=1 Tax=Arthrobacter sp. AK01 TaxID=2894084 RepID=UPI001E412354|nr:hypothetical protein [Arthrobacter sp. AK01]MCD4849660.1 hypothetical protein [Arthrobacter sp. AK01]